MPTRAHITAPITLPKRDQEAGFTLAELVIVMIIIAILLAIAVPTFLSSKKSAKANSVRTAAASINAGIAQFNADRPPVGGTDPLLDTNGYKGVWNKTIMGTAAKPTGLQSPTGSPYIATWPVNPYTANQPIQVHRGSCPAKTSTSTSLIGQIYVCRVANPPGSFHVEAYAAKKADNATGPAVIVYDHTTDG